MEFQLAEKFRLTDKDILEAREKRKKFKELKESVFAWSLDHFELSEEKLSLLIEYHLNDLLSSFLESISEFSNEFNIYMLDMSFMMTPHEEEWKKVKKKISEGKEDRFFHLKDFIAQLEQIQSA